MGLLDELREAQEERGRGGTRCRVCELVAGEAELQGQDAADLEQALRATGPSGITATTIIEVLKRRGVTVSDSQVGNHRRNHLDRPGR